MFSYFSLRSFKVLIISILVPCIGAIMGFAIYAQFFQVQRVQNTPIVATLPIYNYVFQDVFVLGQNADPHSYEPTFDDISRVETADTFIMQGGIDEWAERIQSSSKYPIHIINSLRDVRVSASQPLRYIENKLVTEFDSPQDSLFIAYNSKEVHDESHSEEEEQGDEENHEDIHGIYDPHIWMSPRSFGYMLNMLVDTHGSRLPLRDTSLFKTLAAIDAQYEASLKSCKNNHILASHDALGYIARDYGITIHALSQGETYAPQDIENGKNLVKEHSIGYIVSTKKDEDISGIASQVQVPLLEFETLEKHNGNIVDITAFYDFNLKTMLSALNCTTSHL